MPKEPAKPTRKFDDGRPVWEQQTWEQDKHYNAFLAYKMLPRHSRSLRDGWRVYSKNQHAASPSGGYKVWFKNNDWRYRVDLWDRYQIANAADLEKQKLDEIRMDGLEVIHNGIVRLGKLIYDTKRPYDVAYAVSSVARTVKDLQPKNPLPENEGYTGPEPYRDDWGWNANPESQEGVPDA